VTPNSISNEKRGGLRPTPFTREDPVTLIIVWNPPDDNLPTYMSQANFIFLEYLYRVRNKCQLTAELLNKIKLAIIMKAL